MRPEDDSFKLDSCVLDKLHNVNEEFSPGRNITSSDPLSIASFLGIFEPSVPSNCARGNSRRSE